MTPLVVVTGVAAVDKLALATVLAERLGTALVSLDAIAEELAVDAAQTPPEWLRHDAEAELVTRVDALEGEVVVDWVAPPGDPERVHELLKRWWDRSVEVRCGTGERPPAVGATRTVVVDTSRPVEIGDVVTAVRLDTGARPARRRARGR